MAILIVITIILVYCVVRLWINAIEDKKSIAAHGKWLAFLDTELAGKGIIRNEKNTNTSISD